MGMLPCLSHYPKTSWALAYKDGPYWWPMEVSRALVHVWNWVVCWHFGHVEIGIIDSHGEPCHHCMHCCAEVTTCYARSCVTMSDLERAIHKVREEEEQ